MSTVQSPGSATVINAIATGCGAAFGIQLYVYAEARLKGSGIKCQAEGVEDTSLMEICARKVLDRFQLDTGVHLKTTIPCQWHQDFPLPAPHPMQ